MKKRKRISEGPKQPALPGNAVHAHSSPHIPLSKKKKLNLKRKLKKKLKKKKRRELSAANTATSSSSRSLPSKSPPTNVPSSPPSISPSVSPPPTHVKLSTSQKKMKKKLEAAKFRFLNEQLYTSTSATGLAMMQDDPSQFFVYHRGFTDQMKKWPVNPVSIFSALLRKVQRPLVVADFGCGDAKIARNAPARHTVHSFDLVAANEHVTACDMAHVPLADDTADIAIFCLSLMGTNVRDFLMEARRVLKRKGTLLVAEVKSRFELDSDAVTEARGGEKGGGGGKGGGVDGFVTALGHLGFELHSQQLDNKMFAVFRFKKSKRKPRPHLFNFEFRACVYKKR